MSGPNPHIPEQHHHYRTQDSHVTAVSSTPSTDTVSGIPLVHVYAPPLGHEYGVQQQFPPPLPTAQYFQYGAAGYEYKPEYATQAALPAPPPPPSLYYSRYPTPSHATIPMPQGALPPPLVAPAGHVRTRQVPINYNDGRVYTMTFDDAVVRDDFAKHVLGLVLLQFVLSAVLSALCLELSGFSKVVKGIPWILWIALVCGLMVIVFTKIKPETSRKKFPERYLFVAWTAAWVVSLIWITTLLDLEFLLVLQILLAVIMASLLISSALQKTALLTGRTLLVAAASLLFVAIPLGTFYANDPGVVFFGIFISALVSIFFLFRVHYLMGDEWRKLQSHEVLTAAMNVYF